MDYLAHTHGLQHGGDEELDREMLSDASYPDPEDPDFQYKLYVKREFYVNRVPVRDPVPDDQRLEVYHSLCPPKSGATPAQSFLPKFIHPQTPYTGVVAQHGTGVGKTRTAIYIAEGFKAQVEKYGTKIHVLVPGPLIRKNFIGEIIASTGETYTKVGMDAGVPVDAKTREQWDREVMANINQYYRIYTYRSFSKRVLGEKIKDSVTDAGGERRVARKTEEGDYQRELSVDHIDNLDNGLLIIDEAHNITDNDYGLAVEQVIRRSRNLRVVHLTATPNKNYADGIIQLVNMLRPAESQIDRDRVFTPQGYEMAFRPEGEAYFREMIRGYISYVRGADPLTFAKREDVGIIPPGLDFTKVIQCPMAEWQQAAYDRVQAAESDSFDRESEAVSNFAMPGLTRDLRGITSYHGIEGLKTVVRQLGSHGDLLRNQLSEGVMSDVENVADIIRLQDNREIGGAIFRRPYLARFSSKFDRALSDLEEYVEGQRGARTAFVYSNLVRSGIELFAQVMNENGYLEYRDDPREYSIRPTTRCYRCGLPYGEHAHSDHSYGPAVYTLITGGGEEETGSDDKFNTIRDVFNRSDNRSGQHIKFVLGSRVMKEGVSLRNIGAIMLLDVHFTLGRVEQVFGRGIRFCMHSDLMSHDHLRPVVRTYRYVVAVPQGQSTEEEMYAKAEAKFRLISKVDRICAEEAIDCPLMRGSNIFREELQAYQGCEQGPTPCPAVCGYQDCYYQCSNRRLVSELYDPDRLMFRKLAREELDYSTYDREMARSEIAVAVRVIVSMYRREYVYTLTDILEGVRDSLEGEMYDLYDPFYVYQALDLLIPTTANDFNNWSVRLRDRFGRSGYLIYVADYYIFQPFGEDENLPAYYRSHYAPEVSGRIVLRDYLQSRQLWQTREDKNARQSSGRRKTRHYDFQTLSDYYQSKPEATYVGVLDGPTPGSVEDLAGEPDQFKLRGRRPRVLKKKRQTGVPSLYGSVCSTSKSMEELAKVCRQIGLPRPKGIPRADLCRQIRDRMWALEKYGDGTKTWMLTPADHPVHPAPLNLLDREQLFQRRAEDEGVRITKRTRVDGEELYPDLTAYQLVLDLAGKPSAALQADYQMEKTGRGWRITLE